MHRSITLDSSVPRRPGPHVLNALGSRWRQRGVKRRMIEPAGAWFGFDAAAHCLSTGAAVNAAADAAAECLATSA